MLYSKLRWLIILFAIGALYFPINQSASGGRELELGIDRFIAFSPPWVVPYLVGSALMVVIPLWACFGMETFLFRRYMMANLFATVVSYIVYLGFPTYVSRPNIHGSDVFSWMLRQVYAADRSYNAFPSGHTLYTCISLLFLWQWQPQQRLLWTVLCLLIILSTLFIGQHHILDLLGGLILALISVRVARWIEEFHL